MVEIRTCSPNTVPVVVVEVECLCGCALVGEVDTGAVGSFGEGRGG